MSNLLSKFFYWTIHSKNKMSFYKLSEQRIRRVLNSPYRIEEGVAPKTLAYMQPVSIKTKNKKKIWSSEIWVMIQEFKKNKSKIIKIISAWRYPGMTKPKSDKTLEILKKEYEEYNKLINNLEEDRLVQ
ncbi:MAG: hypothetical protein NZ484_00980 [Patescibacteria group bacterium]|nr:hypothetical protein [Patescibacteria group bacterium]MCX7589527.1 hypothetical protein [Patescibacteria group bacterium]MDW8279949.1 hypothetical protein [bacterium]